MTEYGDYLKALDARIRQLEANGTPKAGSGNGFDADTVDTIHAASISAASKLLALDASQNFLPGGFVIGNQPRCRVSKSATQAITTGTPTALTFNVELYDVGAMHDTVTNNSRITIVTAGTYLFIVNVAWDLNATGSRSASLRLNGGNTLIAATTVLAATANFYTEIPLPCVYQMTANDYVEVIVAHDKGSNLNVIGVDGNACPRTWFSVILISA